MTKSGEIWASCAVDTGDRTELEFVPSFTCWNPKEARGARDDRPIGIGLREIRVISDPKKQVYSVCKGRYER